ncbi:DUF3152 domain-containing protein [Thermocrispum municipale]|uniref:DUF3152 domain-containing protein n=1 Tax=Thermocrispum municipale TaxID=37926 RepID=UPI0005B96A4C|nr:DUF3152 domain-containing protein [Thermocrispum municipale]
MTRRTRSARVRTSQPPERRSVDRVPRYRPGGRRIAAEPLEAAWRPAPERPERARPRSRSAGPSSWVKKYGWRIYALPVLLVVTVLAVLDSRDGAQPPEQTAAAEKPAAGAASGGEGPSATENPAEPVDLRIPTAELPAGGKFTKKGRGTWHVVKGSSPPVGKAGGRLYKYTVEVENGLDPSSYTGDDAFAETVEATLSDPRSWTGGGKVRFQRVDDPADADFRISLTSPATTHRADVCGFQIKYESSCYQRRMDRVIINLARWVRGAKAFNSDMTAYRQYAINHEVGHALNNGHVGCKRNGALAPVMMQQTFGVANNYVAKLNKADPTNYSAVPRDGKVCKPNAWPNPGAE